MQALRVSQSGVAEHLRACGFFFKLSKWVAHQLAKTKCWCCVEPALFLLLFRRAKTWLNSNVFGDEKWVLHANIQCKWLWSPRSKHRKTTANHGIHLKCVMLSIWENSMGMLLLELWSPNTSPTAQLYCQPLDILPVRFIAST